MRNIDRATDRKDDSYISIKTLFAGCKITAIMVIETEK